MTANKTALIAGASGLIGKELLKDLLKHPEYHLVIAILRKPSGIHDEKLMEIIQPFSALQAAITAYQIDDCFCCLGTTMAVAGSKEAFKQVDFEYPLMLAKAAQAQGCKQYLLVSAMGADAKSFVFYNHIKGKVQAELSKLHFPALHIFQPSLLMGKRKENRPGEKLAQNIMGKLHFLFVGPFEKYKPIEAKDVAGAMLKVALSASNGIHIYPSNIIAQIAHQ
jgi:uncharacterized protein YbjT (DUF2867 family)